MRDPALRRTRSVGDMGKPEILGDFLEGLAEAQGMRIGDVHGKKPVQVYPGALVVPLEAIPVEEEEEEEAIPMPTFRCAEVQATPVQEDGTPVEHRESEMQTLAPDERDDLVTSETQTADLGWTDKCDTAEVEIQCHLRTATEDSTTQHCLCDFQEDKTTQAAPSSHAAEAQASPWTTVESTQTAPLNNPEVEIQTEIARTREWSCQATADVGEIAVQVKLSKIPTAVCLTQTEPPDVSDQGCQQDAPSMATLAVQAVPYLITQGTQRDVEDTEGSKASSCQTDATQYISVPVRIGGGFHLAEGALFEDPRIEAGDIVVEPSYHAMSMDHHAFVHGEPRSPHHRYVFGPGRAAPMEVTDEGLPTRGGVMHTPKLLTRENEMFAGAQRVNPAFYRVLQGYDHSLEALALESADYTAGFAVSRSGSRPRSGSEDNRDGGGRGESPDGRPLLARRLIVGPEMGLGGASAERSWSPEESRHRMSEGPQTDASTDYGGLRQQTSQEASGDESTDTIHPGPSSVRPSSARPYAPTTRKAKPEPPASKPVSAGNAARHVRAARSKAKPKVRPSSAGRQRKLPY